MDTRTNRMRFRMVVPAFPAFNIYSRVARLTTALGPLSVATVVNKMDGWDVEVIDENNYRKFGPRDNAGLPDHNTLQTIRQADVVGLYGGLSSTINRLYDLARAYRQKGVITIAGGQHFAGENAQEALQNGVDYVVVGEGENTIRELLQAIRDKRDPSEIRGIKFMRAGNIVQTGERPPITDFESLPLPDFDLIRYTRISIYPVDWTRGCGMNCEFCTVKGKPRSASVERVLEQIATALEKHNARHFFIVDDLFGHKREDTLRLCGMLADYQKAVGANIDITVQIRLDRSRDAELLKAMRLAGINKICIGFESPIADELTAMNKHIKPEDMLAMTKLYHQAGFIVHGMFIFGYPIPGNARLDMTLNERVKHFRSFISKARLDTLQVLLPVPLPGTEMTARLAAQGRIFPKESIGWEYYDGNFPLFRPDDPLTPEDMQTALRKIMGRFYRFRSSLVICLNILVFPAMIFSLGNINFGWRKWHRNWRSSIIRFGGWLMIRHWLADFKKGTFSQKLARAKQQLSSSARTASRKQ
ncbi:B12-binding domain-containing radical SAM protein [Verrucomicrobiota bacterium]